MPVPLSLPLQAFVAAIIKLKARAGIIFCNRRNVMMGTPEQVIKVPFKTNNSFNSRPTMKAPFLPVILSKKTNKQRKICLY